MPPPEKAAAADPERERIRAALVELVAERGYAETRLEDALERAGVAAAVFDRHYESLDHCFAEVWEDFTQEFFERAQAAFRAEEDWREAMRAQAWALIRFFSEDPLRARICLVEVNFAGELAQASRDVFMDAYVDMIHLGRHESEAGDGVPRARAEAVVGAIWEKAAIDANAGRGYAPELVPQMLYFVVLPYLGPEAAREELRRGPEDIARYRRGEI